MAALLGSRVETQRWASTSGRRTTDSCSRLALTDHRHVHLRRYSSQLSSLPLSKITAELLNQRQNPSDTGSGNGTSAIDPQMAEELEKVRACKCMGGSSRRACKCMGVHGAAHDVAELHGGMLMFIHIVAMHQQGCAE